MTLITTTADLCTALENFEPGIPLALDTEADSMHHYEESVCLVSLRQGEHTLLIDSLAEVDFSPLWELASQCVWILHGADFDLRLMRRLGAPEPVAVFDTMIAAQLCGLRSFGYAALVEHFFGVRLDKGNQREDWSQRPLAQDMLDYAARDVLHLEPLRVLLTQRLTELGRLEWHAQSSKRVMETSRVLKVRDLEYEWRVGDTNRLTGSVQALVRALWFWRDAEAKASDVPPYKVLHNEKLQRLAQWADANRHTESPPRSLLPGHLRGERLQRLQDAIASGQASPPVPPLPVPPRPRAHAEGENRAQRLKKCRDQVAERLNIDPTLIASKAIYYAIAYDPAGAPERLLQENRVCPWQLELLGDAIASLKSPTPAFDA